MAEQLDLILSHPYATLFLLAVIVAVIKFGPSAGGSHTDGLGRHSSDDSCGDSCGDGDVGGGCDFGGFF